MNTLIQLKSITSLFVIVILLTCFALPQRAQAVSPAPDGCYPNFTTAEGCAALNSLTSGAGNTGLGWRSLFLNTTGSFNTGVGGGALAVNNGNSNTALGAEALLLNTSGNENTAAGTETLVHNTTGNANTAIGLKALLSNTTGGGNTAVGFQALAINTTGSGNTAIGNDALLNNTTGNTNIVLGAAGANVISASNVICIGNDGMDVSNTTWIGAVYGVTTQNSTTAPVIVSADGQLGTVPSSERFKKDIAAMDKASEAILSLRPVTFHYRTDTNGTPQFGLIAEDVAKVNTALVLPDKEGKPYSVRYEAVNAMLLNEFLKEHRKVEQLTKDSESKFAEQQRQIETLTAAVKEQTAQIQKVSAQLELSKSAPQVADSNY